MINELEKVDYVEKSIIISTVFLAIAWIFSDFLRTWYQLLWCSDLKCDFGFPLFGSHWREILKIETWHETLTRLYYKYPSDSFIVLHEIGGRPEYLIRDPELVKQIAICDFSSFSDRISGVHAGTDPIIGNELTNLTTDEWRRIRNILTSLLSGQKLKQIVIPSLDENKRELVRFLASEIQNHPQHELIIDMMDLSIRSVIDGFCLTAFGLKTDSLRTTGNDYGFFDTTQSIHKHRDSISAAAYGAIISFPRIMKYLFGKSLLLDKHNAFFTKSCNDIAANRIINKINRSDYLQLLQVLRDTSSLDDNDSKSKSKISIVFPPKNFGQFLIVCVSFFFQIQITMMLN